ncbi:M23 family metallopeptidase [Jeotgalibacillus soli]|uniref:M23ase beta-sheet core domain-containing protein n=1 Tax=Jeotgalibacillus soli TaxID=889306 RepID=A0A0C2RP04_9BACL|nr:M23 family metallopeptidase [Jeotgalibacillus soli]KIL51985.1 hypothetical protein KP78_03550 [Jeotgalibacillus soli]
MHQWIRLSLTSIVLFFYFSSVGSAEAQQTREERLNERMEYYIKYGTLTSLPWYYLAAVDQFERNNQLVRYDIPRREGTLSIHFREEDWVGLLNPNKKDNSLESIIFWGGHGRDGNLDGLADRKNDEDVLYTMANYLSEYGHSEEDFKQALTKYYMREESVKQILTITAIYKHFNTLNLYDHTFPLPLQHIYSYRSTWGDSRGWGGRRMHEGTDIFASHGVPVLATTYGVVEEKGWNEYGGWRIGIRDIHNVYHYYAHLSGFHEDIKKGDIVKPGTKIGYVGSTGYGKKGTSGRFPPHLHYGMYMDNGRTVWAFDPFPSLRLWENQERERKNEE